MQRQRIVVLGFMGSMPIAGVIWQHLHYVIGLQRLGHEVFYVEDSGRSPYDAATLMVTDDESYAVNTLSALASRFGFEGRWAFCARWADPVRCHGMTFAEMAELYRTADLILNICGWQEFNDELLVSNRLALVESDPGLEQIRVDRGEAAAREHLLRYFVRFTFGERVPTESFPVPLHGISWLPTRQPIVTDLWDAPPGRPDGSFTSIANWNTSGSKDIEWRGERYLWSKSLEFLKFAAVARLSGDRFTLMSDVRDPGDRAVLTTEGWELAPPYEVSADLDAYRRWIQASKAEFTASKDQYVRLNTGWFSDRSACYLAAGRPVITQQTDMPEELYARGGLFPYETLEQAVDAVHRINADYEAHCRVAREIAIEHFEAATVLESMLERASG
jgi:hypothetical protein